MNDRLGLARKLPLAAVALGGLLVVGQARAAGPYSLYVTVSGAGNHDGSSLANAMTLAEATQAAVAGDVVFVQKGLYQLPQLTTSFNHSGTAQNPIVWEGEISDADLSWEAEKPKPTLSSDGSNSTVLASAIAATFARRGTPIPADLPLGLTETFALDALKQGQWHAFLSRNRLQAPGLEEVVKEIARTVGPLWSGAASR